MPMLPFKPQFAELVRAGIKRQTIRKVRKSHPIQVGDTLILATGSRTKHYRRLCGNSGDFWQLPPVCTTVEPIEIDIGIDEGYIRVGGHTLYLQERLDLVHADGFKSTADFMEFFRKTHGLPFAGVVIRW